MWKNVSFENVSQQHKMRSLEIYIASVYVLFLVNLRWPRKKTFYDAGIFLYKSNTDGTM